ncbi:MAG: DUF2182 domain-containing protein [Rhodospirillaceae bacterium]
MADRAALPLEGLLTRKRLTVSVSLGVLVALAWGYMAVTMGGVGWAERVADICRVDGGQPWGLGDAAVLLVMWLVMSVAMMLPTAAPMILTFADITATKLDGRALLARVGVFAGGYLAVWGGYAVAATGLQWALREAALNDVQAWLAGGLLVVAGLYQFTPLKDLCLSQCRNPMTWFMGNWKNGTDGAWRMGLAHGAWCLGCCWALMLVMIAAGAMNLAWMAVLAALMLAEKVLPRPVLVGRLAGVLLTGWGLALLTV